MDYDKYEEAKRLYETANADQRYVLESLFPELAEPEDEKIRKAIIGYIDHGQHYGVSNKDMIAWLEKQGKEPQRMISAEAKEALYDKPAWNEEDETNLTNTIIMLKEGASHHFTNFSIVPCVEWLKSLKQRIGG